MFLIRRKIRASQDLAAYARESFAGETPLLAGARDLTKRIFKDFKFDPKATTVATPLEEVWEKRRGVCQDFCASWHCVPALARPAPPGMSAATYGRIRRRGKSRLIGADASHAWFSIFCPGTGWVDFDPTNNVQPSEEHITVAHGRDFGRCQSGGRNSHRRRPHIVKVAVDVEQV
ncbi:MAG: transglutaminase family protein [Limisphaerales bacterium]